MHQSSSHVPGLDGSGTWARRFTYLNRRAQVRGTKTNTKLHEKRKRASSHFIYRIVEKSAGISEAGTIVCGTPATGYSTLNKH